jgi:hypothetical protein
MEEVGLKRPQVMCQPGLKSCRLRALLLDGIEHRVRDVRHRLVPGDRLELAFTAFSDALERLGHAIRRVVAVAPAGSLLAAHGIHVGGAGFDLGEITGLLLAEDLAVLHEDPERASAGVAVH